MPEPPPQPDEEPVPEGLSADLWLGGRLSLLQPLSGHRIGTDAALLAAAAGLPAGRTVDVGSGVGAVGLALALQSAGAMVDLVEIDPDLAWLAKSNAARNELGARVRILAIDFLKPRERREAKLANESAACVVTNPPFFEPGRVRESPDAARARAHVFPAAEPGATLQNWILACLSVLAPGGRFVMIYRPDALHAILAATENRLGALTLLPVHPRAGASAHRLIVSGVKSAKAAARIAPALILHEADGRLTAEAEAIHRGDQPVDWGV